MAKSKSLPLRRAMTVCRSSFFLDETRSSSPCTWAFTPLGPSSRMILPSFLASSWLMPSLRLIASRYSLPDQLVLEHVEDGVGPLFAVGPDLHPLLPGPGDRGAHVAEVEAVADLLARLVQRVVDLLPVELGDDIE